MVFCEVVVQVVQVVESGKGKERKEMLKRNAGLAVLELQSQKILMVQSLLME